MSKKAKERFHKQLLKSGSHTKRLEYQSYPEKFFETAINNNFIDKNYTREHHVGKYWCDFAWIEKQRYIEIDGQQHERNPYQKQHDREKDAFLEGCGWIGLRIPWKNLIYDTHGVIEKAKSFIDNGEVIPDFQRYAYLTNHQKRMLEKYGVSNPGKYGVPFYGRVKKPYEYWKTRLALLDKYDKKSYGWIQKAHIETGLSIPIIRNTCNRFGIQWRTARRANSP
jgi:very-short-patch-repair endonuclease